MKFLHGGFQPVKLNISKYKEKSHSPPERFSIEEYLPVFINPKIEIYADNQLHHQNRNLNSKCHHH